MARTQPREQRLLVAARYREATHDWPEAIATYRTLWDLFYDNPEYGLRLANAQIGAGKPRDAVATIAVLRARADKKISDPRTDLQEAFADGLQSDTAGKLALASRAADAAMRLTARQLAAEAYLQKGDALYGMSRNDDALEAYRSAEAIHRQLGNQFGMASVLLHSAGRETAAWSVPAELRLARHDTVHARQAIARGHQAFAEAHEFQARMQYRLTAARAARSRAGLRALVVELESKNWSALAAEARRALAGFTKG
jgi:tetratricopeptide (TPR) repeat protein